VNFLKKIKLQTLLLQWNWTEYLTLMFEGIENVTLDLEGEDKIMVTNANYLNSLLKLLSGTPKKTLGKYRPLFCLVILDGAHHISAMYTYTSIVNLKSSQMHDAGWQ